jgi:nitrile hydratase accessory protein
MAVKLNEAGVFQWSEWAETLGAELKAEPERPYYESWLSALEMLVEAKGLMTEAERHAREEAWERAAGIIEPDVHVPLGDLRLRGAPQLDPDIPTVVYCAVGIRSLDSDRVMRGQFGFRAVTSLRGGIRAWRQT